MTGTLPHGSHLESALVWQLRAAGVPAPEREHVFARPRRFRFDLAWPERLLAVEVDGGAWSAGRHVRPQGFERDCEKSCIAAAHGWRVLHVTGAMVESGEAVGFVEAALRWHQ